MAGRTGFGGHPTRVGVSWPVSEGCPKQFGGFCAPGKFDHTGAPGFWQGFWGDRGERGELRN
jgi:hypothetical protein